MKYSILNILKQLIIILIEIFVMYFIYQVSKTIFFIILFFFVVGSVIILYANDFNEY
jgi:hypothetical protein